MDNFYYDPEKFGLEIVGSIDFGGNYDFDIVAVFRNEDLDFFWAEDSGCSCPCPFEDHTLEDLEPLKSLNALKIRLESGNRSDEEKAEIAELLETLHKLGLR